MTAMVKERVVVVKNRRGMEIEMKMGMVMMIVKTIRQALRVVMVVKGKNALGMRVIGVEVITMQSFSVFLDVPPVLLTINVKYLLELWS